MNPATRNKFESMKAVLFLAIITQLASCFSHSKSSYYSNRLSDLSFVILEGNEFLIPTAHHLSIQECISMNEDVKMRIKTIDAKGLSYGDINLDVTKEGSRLVVKRGDLGRVIPTRLFKTNSEFEFRVGINNSGEVVMTKLLRSNLQLKEMELKKLMSCILDYKYEEDATANCLQFGCLTIKIAGLR